MARERRHITVTTTVAAGVCLAATILSAAVVLAEPAPASRSLASELRIALGDLRRLAGDDLPPRHAEGLQARITGALGLLPWLLTAAGDEAGAEALVPWQGAALDDAEARTTLATELAALAEDHPLDLAARSAIHPPGAALLEAQAIHETYCFGCHDDYGNGDPDLILPSRDLRLMAQQEPGDIFLARLISGVKGDESIAFRNPLTDDQILALWAYYRRGDS
jgi:hypothetical protein